MRILLVVLLTVALASCAYQSPDMSPGEAAGLAHHFPKVTNPHL